MFISGLDGFAPVVLVEINIRERVRGLSSWSFIQGGQDMTLREDSSLD